MSEGWIKLFRSVDGHPCLEKFDARGVWDSLLLKAAHAPRPVRLGGQMVTLQRGQLAVSVSAFAETGGISRKRMRNIIELFRANHMIETGQAKGHAFTVITICNYDEYQKSEREAGQGEGHDGANEGPTKGQARAKLGPTIEQEGKKDSSLRSESMGGDEPKAQVEPKPKRTKLPPGTRIPDDWQPSPEDRSFAHENGFSDDDIKRIAIRFRNYWMEKRGTAACKVHWNLAWQNWLTREQPSRAASGGQGPGGGGYRREDRPTGRVEQTAEYLRRRSEVAQYVQ